jgi:hypothetical protein
MRNLLQTFILWFQKSNIFLDTLMLWMWIFLYIVTQDNITGILVAIYWIAILIKWRQIIFK